MTRIAQMIYMLSQCKDAKDNPAALFARMRRHEWREFLTRMKRVNSKCSSIQLRANSAIYLRHSRLVWTHLKGSWNSLHNRCEFASWEGLLPGSSSLVAKCIPVFVKVGRCIYSFGYPHTTTITLSSIVVSDFLPPLVMMSLLEQAPDWLSRCEYLPMFWFFNSRDSRHLRCSREPREKTLNSHHSRCLIRANSAAGLDFASLHWLNM